MRQSELERILLLQAQREVAEAARVAVAKFGKAVPKEAREGFMTSSDMAALRIADPLDFSIPIVAKAMAATTARVSALSYPPDGVITQKEADALESLKLSQDQAEVVERLIAEACHSAFFHFFSVMDSVGDPSVAGLDYWGGARFAYPRKEGPMLHDAFGEMYYRLKNEA